MTTRKKILSDGWAFLASDWDISLLEERVKFIICLFHPFNFIIYGCSNLFYGLDSMLFNFCHKLCEFCLNSPAKILAVIISLEHYDYFYNDSKRVVCVYRECKSGFQFYFPGHELFLVQQLQDVKKCVCIPTFLSDSFTAPESVVTVLSAVPFS